MTNIGGLAETITTYFETRCCAWLKTAGAAEYEQAFARFLNSEHDIFCDTVASMITDWRLPMPTPGRSPACDSAWLDRREQLLFCRDYAPEHYSSGGLAYFERLSVENARRLLWEGLMNPLDRQNEAPSAREMVEFCDASDRGIWYLHGYAVSPKREDCRVTFEGVGSDEMPDPERIAAFASLFRRADTLCIDEKGCYCWYD